VIEFYAQIKFVHVAAVVASGALFLLRGLLVQGGGARLALAPPLRYASWSIDTVLLTAALMLATMLPSALFANGWLAAKLLLLVVYVALGSFAFRARTAGIRALAYVAALATFVAIAGIARAHHPLGWFEGWAG
jgi:uncharacterized membrane protein SirB2